MQNLTPEGQRRVAEIAGRYGVGPEAASSLLEALNRGNGAQAQFNHPDLGGMGQWSQGGMIMVGDMFNHDLKHRVNGLCNELAGLLRSQPFAQNPSAGEGARAGDSSQWWPADLGSPASAGAQNDMRYAYFPSQRRLAIQQGGRVRVYDAGEHSFSGFSQAQSGDQSLSFTSQLGRARIDDLREVTPPDGSNPPQPKPANTVAEPTQASAPTSGAVGGEAIFAAIERLAELRQKDILSDDEYAAKKRELLSRL